jgi:DNA mismatch endonuclease, patch repair protein
MMPTSWASSAAVRAVMRANRKRDTAPELRLRSALHRLGLRFRVACRPTPDIPFTADIVFRKARVAVFVDGCYWHGCPIHGTQAHTNAAYWGPKIERNRQRDLHVDALLRAAGWEPIRVWEHDLLPDAVQRVSATLKARSRFQ